MRKSSTIASTNLLAYCMQRYGGKDWNDNNDRITKLYRRLLPLSEEERDLIFTLTDDFEYCSLLDVNSHLHDAYDKIPKDLKDDAKKIIIAPLKDPIISKPKTIGDFTLVSKAKSPDLYFPMFRYSFSTTDMHYNKIDFCPDASSISSKYNDRTLLIMLDDFVGSGMTVSKIVSHLGYIFREQNKQLRYKDIVILSAFAMNQGIVLLRSRHGIQCYANRILQKGISSNENLNPTEKVHLLSVMQEIEHKVVPTVGYVNTLGYMQSEALVSIGDKCPNNTFPFYWYGNKKSELQPIFPREK